MVDGAFIERWGSEPGAVCNRKTVNQKLCDQQMEQKMIMMAFIWVSLLMAGEEMKDNLQKKIGEVYRKKSMPG